MRRPPANGLVETNTLSSLRSRWTTPAACAARARRTARAGSRAPRRAATRPSIDARAERHAREPLHHEVRPAVAGAGREHVGHGRVLDPGWTIRASRRNVSRRELRRRAPPRCASLIAARLPNRVWTTAYTVAMPPRPSSRSTRHAPICDAGRSVAERRRRAGAQRAGIGGGRAHSGTSSGGIDELATRRSVAAAGPACDGPCDRWHRTHERAGSAKPLGKPRHRRASQRARSAVARVMPGRACTAPAVGESTRAVRTDTSGDDVAPRVSIGAC